MRSIKTARFLGDGGLVEAGRILGTSTGPAARQVPVSRSIWQGKSGQVDEHPAVANPGVVSAQVAVCRASKVSAETVEEFAVSGRREHVALTAVHDSVSDVAGIVVQRYEP